MKKVLAILGVLAALAISAAPAFAATINNGGVFVAPASNILWGGIDNSQLGNGYLYSNADPSTPICGIGYTQLGTGGEVNSLCAANSADVINSFDNTAAGDYTLVRNHGILCGGATLDQCESIDGEYGAYESQNTEIFSIVINSCSPSTISNGTIGSYPTCAITCNSSYTLSAGACVASGGGSSSSPSSTYTIMGITLATGTAAMFLANAASTVSDPGLLEVVAIAVGIPLAFYIFHQLIGLLPKGRAGRRS